MEQQGEEHPRGPLPDSYPAGDEFILVHIVTGRVIPPGGLPKDADAMVANVETLMNIGLDQPVTQKYLTVAGAVRNPSRCAFHRHHHRRGNRGRGRSPQSTTQRAAGRRDDGKAAAGLDVPVTKTTGGIVVLPPRTA